jgi:hypothetical protein
VRTYASVCTLIHATAGTDKGERGERKMGTREERKEERREQKGGESE